MKNSFFRTLFVASLCLHVGAKASFANTTTEKSCQNKNLDQTLSDIQNDKIPKRKIEGSLRGFQYKVYSLEVQLPSGTQKIYFDQYLAQDGHNLPTDPFVLFFCGGPGIPCTPDGRPSGVSKNINVILFDYVGLGNNIKAAKSNEDLSIESQAQVAEQIIEKLQLKNFALYGQSFGTSVATVLASNLSKKKTAILPRFVVLDGVLGSQSHTNNQKANEWFSQRVNELIPNKLKSDLAYNLKKLNKAVSAEEKQDILMDFKTEIEEAMSGGPLEVIASLNSLLGNQPEQAPKPKVQNKKELKNDFDPTQMGPQAVRQYRAAGCQVNSSTAAATDSQLIKNLLPGLKEQKVNQAQICSCPLLNRHYDAADFPLTNLRILYVNSIGDIQTPIEGAIYHSQKNSDKNEITFAIPKDTGHGELERSLNDCTKKLFESIFSQKNVLPDCIQNISATKPVLDELYIQRTKK